MIKKLASCVGRYKKDAILTPIMVAFEVVLEVLIPFLMSLMIDNGINKGDMGYIWKMGGILIVAAMVALIFGALPGNMRPRPRRDMRETYGGRCTIKYRSILFPISINFYRQPGDTADNGCDQRSKCVSNVDPYRGTVPLDVGLCIGHGVGNQPAIIAGIFVRYAGIGNRPFFDYQICPPDF